MLYEVITIFPLHRDLGAFLVKGADPNRLMAQILGKRDGFSKGIV